jgi:SOS response regulatory protein OraA/RecX|tara:strand:+ start:6766 stop:7200 length:435 start_codon:yes stop_codon:yes gene_type:complete
MSQQKLKHDILRLLARREYSVFEIVVKMSHKGYSDQDIDHVLDELKRLGLQSDERYAMMMCDHLMQQGKGKMFLSAKLNERGVQRSLIDQVALEFDENQSILNAYARINNVSPDRLEKRLYSRGFSGNTIGWLKQKLVEEGNES